MRASAPDLTVASLMEQAAERAGSEDWGGRDFAEPLGLLLSSCREMDALTPLGWSVLRSIALRHLHNRLLIAAFVRANPGVAQRPLRGAIVVTGLPRTGTTVLQNLLALDPANRFLALWEALRPVPPEEDAARARLIRQSHAWLERFYELVPTFRAVHPLDPEGPEECDTLLQNAFVSQHFDDMFDAPAYSDWLANADLGPQYAYYARQLRVLGPAEPGAWVLKSPLHVGHLDALLGVLDGALIVHCHRRPLAAVSSYASLMGRLRSAYSDDVAPRTLGRQALLRCQTAITRALAVRDAAGPDAFVDVSHGAIVRDPVAVVHTIYRRAGREVGESFEARMRNWVRENPRNRYGDHRHDRGELGLTEAEVAAAFAPYTERFGDVWR
ncbi:MAG: sulfotransferase family protein [Solirubrobacteraceae bacterium]